MTDPTDGVCPRRFVCRRNWGSRIDWTRPTDPMHRTALRRQPLPAFWSRRILRPRPIHSSPPKSLRLVVGYPVSVRSATFPPSANDPGCVQTRHHPDYHRWAARLRWEFHPLWGPDLSLRIGLPWWMGLAGIGLHFLCLDLYPDLRRFRARLPRQCPPSSWDRWRRDANSAAPRWAPFAMTRPSPPRHRIPPRHRAVRDFPIYRIYRTYPADPMDRACPTCPIRPTAPHCRICPTVPMHLTDPTFPMDPNPTNSVLRPDPTYQMDPNPK